MDLLNFVDTRVTLDDHPLNQFIRDSIQLNFDDFSNELKLHIGTEGIQYRLVKFIIHFLSNYLQNVYMYQYFNIILFFNDNTETHD